MMQSRYKGPVSIGNGSYCPNRAIDQGANFLAEGFLFAVAAGLSQFVFINPIRLLTKTLAFVG